MDPQAIPSLLAPFVTLDDELARLISTYLDLLLRWNTRTNLTAVRDRAQIITRHFGESLFAAAQLLSRGASISAIDVGSGAGFPGLPLKLWAPALRLTLIEAQNKKVAFLREVTRTLTLTNIDVFSGRAEDFPDRADLVTLRAVERFDQIAPAAARLVAPGGRFALLISAAQVPRAHELLPQLAWSAPVPIPQSQQRILLVGTNPESHESS